MGCPFFFLPPWPNLPSFHTHQWHQEILMTRTKQRTRSTCQPGLSLSCSFLIVCGLSMEIVSPGSHQQDSHSRGQRRAVPLTLPVGCAETAGFHSQWAAPEGRVLILILTTRMALSSSSGRFTNCHGTTSSRKQGRIWLQIKGLTNVSYKLPWVSVSAGEGRRAGIARVFQVRPEAN